MSQINVLVVGAGIAGSITAYWLGKAGINVTVIERAGALRTSGQGVDVRGRALDIVRRMGLEDEIRASVTEEAGLVFVDDDNKNLATLDVDSDQSFTAEIEIIRSDLAKILYKAALSTGNVNFEFGASITSLRQTASHVNVDLSDGRNKEYALVVAADGFGSKTRQLILGPEEAKASIRSLDSFTAYFTLPLEDQDTPRSRWYMTTGRRAALLRPKSKDQSSAYLTVITKSDAAREAVESRDIEVQKTFLTKTFSTAGWELPRILRAMQNTGPDDFYFQEVGQILLDPSSWHRGRCVLTGDAAYCPSAFTGMGTTLAIIGAYVLAAEIVKQVKEAGTTAGGGGNPDFDTAFTNYEDQIGEYVKGVQKLPLGGAVVSLINPNSGWHLWFLRYALWLADRTGLFKALSLLGGGPKTEGFQLPEYQFLKD